LLAVVVASLYRWLNDVDRKQLAQSHLDIAFAADQIDPESEPAVGGERKKDKRHQRTSKAARVAASVAKSIAAALAPPPPPKAALKKAARKGKRGRKRGRKAAVVMAPPPPPPQEPVAEVNIVPVVPVAPKRRAYAKSGTAYEMARAKTQSAAHLYVKPADIERARKMAISVRERCQKLSVAARRFLVGRIKKNKYLNCFEMRKAIESKYRVKVCDSTIYNCLATA